MSESSPAGMPFPLSRLRERAGVRASWLTVPLFRFARAHCVRDPLISTFLPHGEKG